MNTVIWSGDSGCEGKLGGKARALASLQRAGLPIPPWFVVSPDAHPNVPAELTAALQKLCPDGELVAVRSSASDEDGAEHSFAGQLESFLSVPHDQVADKIQAVWRSGFSERILAYRREHGLSATPRVPSVLVQRMVNADAAGVAFGADPVTGRRGIVVVAAVRGLGDALVSGEASADTIHVDRDDQIVKREIIKEAVLTDDQTRSVAALARRAGKHFGRPQDIEWAFEKGKLFLLQSRPITSLAHMADPDGAFNLWDNSNIVESYSGVTTPLTFSFARHAYDGVYREFCRMMRVPKATIAAHDDTFRNMLGLIRGRVYYNLLNWYRVLAMLPGFTVNRKFMEQMMGVKEGLPEHIVSELGTATGTEKLRDAFHLANTVCGLITNHFLLPVWIRRFYERLNHALAPTHPPLEEMRPDELAAHFLQLERQLLSRWDAPLINDFLAMIFYGVLRRLTEKWCGDKEGTLQNDLISGEGGMISAEPAKRVREMAASAAKYPPLVALLCEGEREDILKNMDSVTQLRQQYNAYLEKFGDRCLDELKLESSTLHDDPMPLLRAIGNFVRCYQPTPAAKPGNPRQTAEERVVEALTGQPFRRFLFVWVLDNARARVRDRENLRFERTRLFGRVRRIFVEIGRRFHALDLLDDPRDVFYMELDEVLGFIGGTSTTTNLKGLVALRKTEFAAFRESPQPDSRFETRGIVYQGNEFRRAQAAEELGGDERKGIGCCPGIVRGAVRVITDPTKANLRERTILVAERTDPGWIMLFPSANGLLVERGSLLSHSAIVARELGIPAIVSVPGLMQWLKDGDWVELNGSTGMVRKIPDPLRN